MTIQDLKEKGSIVELTKFYMNSINRVNSARVQVPDVCIDLTSQYKDLTLEEIEGLSKNAYMEITEVKDKQYKGDLHLYQISIIRTKRSYDIEIIM